MSFGMCENQPKMTKVRHLGGQRQNPAEGRRHEAEPREPVLGGFTSFGTSFKEHSTRLAPPSKDGVGGFKG